MVTKDSMAILTGQLFYLAWSDLLYSTNIYHLSYHLDFFSQKKITLGFLVKFKKNGALGND